ncbi:MAG TPA: cytochrome P450 [Solirubrobacteraceae bacterium]|nr:cytochrome P450 [Solirubrobacteraceae bacterium]
MRELLTEFDHNALTTRAQARDLFADMHANHPLFHSQSWGGFWVATRHATLREIGRDSATFISGDGVMIPPLGHGRALVPMETDGARHSRYREILLPHLGPRAVAELEPRVRGAASGILQDLAPGGAADLYELYCKRLPAEMITFLLDIEDEPEFWDWTETLIYGRFERPEDVRHVGDSLYRFFEEVVARRRGDRIEPGASDLVSVLIDAHASGKLESNEEVVDLCFFLLIAGLDNTAFGIRAALWHLAAYPAHRQALLEDPELLRPFVEEVLRLYAPVPGLGRALGSDVELEGCPISQGDHILLLFAAANRDPALFEDPHEFKLNRQGNPHVAFGVGAHRCLGSHLARLELRIAVGEILRRFPDYELVAPETTSWHPAGPLEARWP